MSEIDYNVLNYLETNFDEIEPLDFYNYIFPNFESAGEYCSNFEKPNPIFLYTENEKIKRRILLKNELENDFYSYINENSKCLTNGLLYRGKANKLENAQKMNAMIIDLDDVGYNEILNLFGYINTETMLKIPRPTLMACSGTGLHLYFVFNESIDLFPNIKLQLKSLKYALTKKFWKIGITTKSKTIQFQSINQFFRAVGSANEKYEKINKNGEKIKYIIKIFKTGEKIDLNYLNSFVENAEKVDITKKFRPTKISLEEAKKLYPEWFEEVIINGKKFKKGWVCSEYVYKWWLKQIDNVKAGHRYFYLMCTVIYGFKCRIPKKKVEKDLYEIFKILKNIEHTNPLTEFDLKSAMEVYDKEYSNFKIEDIVALTQIQITKNKRNFRKQKLHLQGARAIQEINDPNGEWRNKNGRPTAEGIVSEWRKNNPEGRKIDCIKSTGLSKKTIYKWWN